MIFKSSFPEITWVKNEWGEFPDTYSDNACRIISDKYFANDETSWFDVVYRVSYTIAMYGFNNGWFDNPVQAEDFAFRLAGYQLRQQAMFNSPVYFNVGVHDDPQCSACFIQSVDDTMESILDLVKKEGMLFKYGSGTGTNISPLRRRGAPLSSGGEASGPLDFMRLLDAGASVVKSGGKTRRAAKMVIMDDDHPDIMDFIWCKAKEDRKARKLIAAGLSPDEAYASVDFQNGNNTVRLTDNAMEICQPLSEEGHHDHLVAQIAKACWECGDPGVQFTDTINDNMPSGLVCNSSNPCGEYMFIDESACNLASINVEKAGLYIGSQIVWDFIQAMDIIVDMAGYPTEEIWENSVKYRPLGLGITGLAACLMNNNLEYDSDAGREYASNIMKDILDDACSASYYLAQRFCHYPGGTLRNAQLTLIAPTGTISFAMDCESTGIEPVYAETQTKHLAGGGTLSITPSCIELARARGADEVVQTAVGESAISPEAHLKMCAAVQPHLSGAISKTINLPADATVADIEDCIYKGWELGLKGFTIYRDGCKGIQPLVQESPEETSKDIVAEHLAKGGEIRETSGATAYTADVRRKMPETRGSITHKFSLNGIKGYFTVGLYDDERPGEVFVHLSKQGSTIQGLIDAWATTFSMGLQYGVPIRKFVDKFKGTRFEPHGFTGSTDIPTATSVIDYIVRWIDMNCLTTVGDKTRADLPDMMDRTFAGEDIVEASSAPYAFTGNLCSECGGMLQITGTCSTCTQCGETTGCG